MMQPSLPPQPELVEAVASDLDFDLASCGLAVLAHDGRFLRVNRAWLDWTFYSRDELLNLHLPELLTPRGRAAYDAEIAPLLGSQGDVADVGVEIQGKTGEIRHLYLNIVARIDAAGEARLHLSAFRGEHRAQYEAELQRARQTAQHFADIVEASPDGIVSIDVNGMVLSANQGFATIFRYGPGECVGRDLAELILPEEFKPQYDDKLRRARLGALISQDVKRRRKDGSLIDVSLSTAPIKNEHGQVTAISAIYRDITEQVLAADHIEFLLREVNHRSKNLLSVVQAVARQTSRLAATPEKFIDGFMTRLASIAASHDLLVSRDWHGIQIKNLTSIQFDYLGEAISKRIDVSGDFIEINPRAAESYGLALHELSTNAVKHGALSNAAGRVDLRFTLSPKTRIFTLSWREKGGPNVKKPDHMGFGSTVLTRIAPISISGQSKLVYEPDGLRYTLIAPLDQIVMGGEAAG